MDTPLWKIVPGPSRNIQDPDGKGVEQVFRLQNCGESENALDIFKPWNRMGRPPLCRVDVKIGEVVLDTCLDSGTTYTLLSKEIFEKVKQHCGEVYPAEGVNLYGASGKKIALLGRSDVQFWIGCVQYSYPVLIGELSGVDMLIGMDWLVAVEAKLDFESMSIRIGPTQEVSLWTSRKENGPLNKGEGFVHACGSCVLYARHTTRVPCYITGEWITSRDAIFDTNVKIGQGVDILDCIVHPDREGRFSIGITNNTDNDLELGQDMVLGHLSEVQNLAQLESYAPDPDSFTPCFAVWRIASHVWSEPIIEEMSPYGQ